MKNDFFVNHHVHSHFSLLDGYPSPEQIVNRVVDLGQQSVSVTDHGNLTAIPDMYRAAKKAGIGFTPGVEMYFTRDRTLHHRDRWGEQYYHLIMLAHNDQGYHNLIKLQTIASEEGFYSKPRIDYEGLSRYSEGITVTTACLGGVVNKALSMGNMDLAKKELSTFIDIYGKDNVFVEVQNHGIEDQKRILRDQVELSKWAGLGLLATCDSHYTVPGESGVHDTMLCCSAGGQKHETNRFKFDGDQFYIHSGEEMLKLFPEDQFPGAISNTVELAERTDFTLKIDEDKEYLMPSVKTREGMTEMETLRHDVYDGARDVSRYGDGRGNIDPKVKERIDYELSVVEGMGYAGYFLIVANMVRLFAEKGIYVGPGRGCLAGDTPVLTSRGWIPIRDVKTTDLVADSTGHLSPVLDTYKHSKYEGESMVRLLSENRETITLTEKHKVLLDGGNGDKRWEKAGLVKPNDVILSIFPKGRFTDSITIGGEGDTGPECGTFFKKNQIGFLHGAFLHANVNDGKVTWFFNPEQSELAYTVSELIDSVFSLPRDIGVDEDGLINYVGVESTALAQYVEDIPRLYAGIGPEEFVRGFVQSIMQFNSGEDVSTKFTTSTEEIAQSVSLACKSAGILCRVAGTSVDVEWSKKAPIEDRHMIVSTERVEPEEYVYDIAVGGDPSYLTSFGTVHNSAPGSVIIYCLGITGMDPLEHDLYFERFLNPDRISMPDIDIDVPKHRRKEALKIIEDEYGEGHVAHLSNYQMLGMRESLKRVSKAYGLSPTQANKFTDTIATHCEDMKISLKEFASNPMPQSIVDDVPETKYERDILRDSALMEGKLYANGVHACGVVVTSGRVDDHFPLRHAKSAVLPVCQYDGSVTEALGGVKMDILGLINLDQCVETERNILLDLGEEVDSSSLPLDDEEVFHTISQGRGGGIFQLGCLSGDTVVDGETLSDLYQRRHSTSFPDTIRSVFMGEGDVRHNAIDNIVNSGQKQTFTLSAGSRSIRATAKHKFFTQRGWVKLADLRVGEDKILDVDDDVAEDKEAFIDTIRGREDVIRIFGDNHPTLRRVRSNSHVTRNGVVFYPTFRVIDNPDLMVLIYPDKFIASAEKARDAADGDLAILSFSEVIEQFYEHRGDGEDLGVTPFGTKWVQVNSVEEYGFEETYDIVMRAPVHNFIANGLMVHNSGGIRSLSRMMKPEGFSDISALLALYRPGPMGMGTHEEYCSRKNFDSDYEVTHDDMRDLLHKTHGLAVYQEDLMTMARHYAGYTGAEADDLRKAVAKKIPAMMDAQKSKFIPAVNSSFPDNLGQTLWDIIEPFGEYAFPKSHSCAYAAIVYRTAWLKTHYPAQFSAAAIDENIGKKEKLVYTISWVREEGVGINYPDVNLSEERSVTTEDSVSLPLNIIAGLGDNKAHEMIAERKRGGKYSSVIDFVSRTEVPRKLLSSMAKAGAFDSLGANRAAIIDSLDEILSLAKSRRSRDEYSAGLFGDFIAETDDTEDFDLTYEPSRVLDGEKVIFVDQDEYGKWERESMGVLVGPHPFESVRELQSAEKLLRQYKPLDRFEAPDDNASFSGVIFGIENKISRNQKEYCSFNLETNRASVPAVAFTHISSEFEGALVACKGKVEDDSAYNEDDEDSVFVPKAVCYDMTRVNTDLLKERG